MAQQHQKIISCQQQSVSNWGRFPKLDACIHQPNRPCEITSFTSKYPLVIAQGNGRCYGDSALQKHIISTLNLNRFLHLDIKNKTLHCEAGVLLSDILKIIVPKGYFLPVVPGTRLITIGGAVAANVHGKNHHRAGSIAKYIQFLTIIGENGQEIRCSRSENTPLFQATIGGMGLTGIITSVCIQFIPFSTSYIKQKAQSFNNIEELAEQLILSDQKNTYTVAWMDGMSKKGRGVLLSGNNCELADLPNKFKPNPLQVHNDNMISIPPIPSSQVLNKLVLRAYNSWFYHANKKEQIIHYSSFFFPLDKLDKWSRLYGPKGMLQYQFVLPLQRSKEGLSLIWSTIQSSSSRPYLVVLKAFGDDPTPVSPYSFPMRGLSLALDFKKNAATLALLDQLDKIIVAYQGRLYLTKDARMKAEVFKNTYPKITFPSGKYQSLQSQRLQNK